MKLISVIVPVYNSEKTINRCIKSILNQTYPNLEIILINDGSKDCSKEICEEWAKKDKRIVFISKKNEGVSKARNLGLELAKGDLISFIDSDDYIEKNMYSEMVKNLENTNSDLVVCKHVIEREGKKITQNYNYEKNIINKKDILPMFFQGNVLSAYLWNKLYKKELFNDVEFKNYNMLEDLDVMYKILDTCNSISYICEEYYNYVYHDGDSLSRRYNIQMLKDFEKSIQEMYKYFSNRTELSEYLNYNKVLMISSLYSNIAKSDLSYNEIKQFDYSYMIFKDSFKKIKDNKKLFNEFSNKDRLKIFMLNFNKKIFIKIIKRMKG